MKAASEERIPLSTEDAHALFYRLKGEGFKATLDSEGRITVELKGLTTTGLADLLKLLEDEKRDLVVDAMFAEAKVV